VVAVAAPTWADVDAMIGELKFEWHRRAATMMRFTGLRASQTCGLLWRDVDLEGGVLRVRTRVRGAKSSRARVIPLHSWLVAQMAGWGLREGLVFPRRYKGKDGKPRLDPYRGDALVAPYRRAWRAAGVPVERWDKPEGSSGERGKGSPTHAIRRCIRTELVRAGVEEALVLYLVGQSQGITAAAYVPESSPEQSPYWPRLLEAVEMIPVVGQAKVVPIRRVGRGDAQQN
jgi:integrase